MYVCKIECVSMCLCVILCGCLALCAWVLVVSVHVIVLSCVCVCVCVCACMRTATAANFRPIPSPISLFQPVVLIGNCVGTLTVLLFGLVSTYQAACVVRFFGGLMNGVVG
jgi:hypothetical protein